MRFAPASALRGLLSKLHPVLPPVTTPRESQQLLSALQHSFKKQLDEVHPPVQARTDHSLERGAGGPVETTHSAANAADDHVYSVLQHPLLAKHHRPSRPTERVNRSVEPRAVVAKFERAVAEGKVSDSVLSDVVASYSRLALRSSLPVADSLGRKIAVWFTSSKSSTKANFLISKIKTCVVPVMYADGQEQVVWEWLRLLYEESLLESLRHPDPRAMVGFWRLQTAVLVKLMVREQIKRRNVRAAVQEYMEAWNFMQNSGLIHLTSSMAAPASDEVTDKMGASATMLINTITMNRHTHRIDGALYDAFSNTVERTNHLQSHRDVLLPVYHPLKPTAEKLLEELQTGHFWTLVEGHIARIEQRTLMENTRYDPRKATIIALLDAAQVLLDQGNTNSAQYVLNEVEHRFPEHLKPRQPVECTARIALARSDVNEPRAPIHMALA